jgi:hypothetical protein
MTIFGFCFLMAFASVFAQSKLQIGTAEAVINPPIGSFIAGDKQNRKFTGVLDSLYFKVVVLYDGKTALALATVDCIGLMYPDIDKIRQKAAQLVKNIPLKANQIVISSTHTHSGPDVVGLWGTDYQHSGVDEKYMSFLVETAAQQILKASQNLQAVSVYSTETQFGEEWVQNICNEEIDRSVNILQFVNKKKKTIASFTNFACHPTYLDAKFTNISADYVGGFYREMSKNLGGMNLFLQGAIGGWVQPVDGEGNPEKADKRGRELAQSVQKSLKNRVLLKNNQLKIKSLPIKLKVENPAWQQLASIGTIKRNFGEIVDTEVVYFEIGNAQFASHPGETAPFYGLETKKMMQKQGPKFVLGLTMDALGYICKPIFFEDEKIPHAPYLTSMSLGKSAAPDLMEALKKLINSQ